MRTRILPVHNPPLNPAIPFGSILIEGFAEILFILVMALFFRWRLIKDSYHTARVRHLHINSRVNILHGSPLLELMHDDSGLCFHKVVLPLWRLGRLTSDTGQ